MKKSLRNFLIYTILAVLVLPTWLVISISGATKAKAAEMVYLNEGFDDFPVTQPDGWSFSGVVASYSSTGELAPSLKMDDNGDEVVTPDFSMANTLAFWAKGTVGSGPMEGELEIKYQDSSGWHFFDEIIVNNTNGFTKKYNNLPKTATKIKFVFKKVTGNLALDNVAVSLEDNDDPAVFAGSDRLENKPFYQDGYATDENGIKSYLWSKVSGPGTINFGASNLSSTLISASTDGEYKIKLTAVDNVGNVGYDEFNLIWDTVEPFVSIIQNVSAITRDNTPDVVVNVENDASFKIKNGANVLFEGVGTGADAAVTLPSLADGNYNLTIIGKDENGNSNTKNFAEFTVDTKAPEVLNVENGKLYKSVAPTFTEGTATLNGETYVSGTEISENGDYELIVTDSAGNQTVVDFAVFVSLASPVVTYQVDNKTVKLTWKKVTGAVDYLVYVGTSASNLIVSSESTKGETNYSHSFSDYGNYYFKVISVSEDSQSDIVSGINELFITLNKPAAPAPVAVSAPVSQPVETPAPVSIAPQKVQAAPSPAPSATIEATDEEGKIKGEDDSDNEEEKVNWTPWIVLFVLILLAGAATGGYFYWFNGEEEVSTVVKEVKKEKQVVEKKKTNAKPNKKSKRW